MIRAEDLAEAVTTGVLTDAQARALEAIAAARHRARTYAVGREERFRIMGGFNDFFIAVGVILLAIAVGNWSPFAGLVAMWGLAEYLTGRLKLVAPSIVIVVALAIFAAMAMVALTARDGPLIFPATAAVVGLHYLRFRLPFSLFVLAASGVFAIILLVSTALALVYGKAFVLPDLAMRGLLFALGLGVFGWAMAFDISDTERLTRRSDCGFWLHLIAAPLIVHSLTSSLMSHPLWPGMRHSLAEVSASGIIVAVLVVIAISTVALIIDRRALLVSGLGYLGSALAYTLSKIAGSEPSAYVLPVLLFLGVLIIVLGVGWRHIRAVLMSSLSGEVWKRAVPPYERVA